MKELNRLQVGNFKIEDAITVEDIENGNISIITIEEFFKDKEKIILDDKKMQLFLNGVQLTYNLPNDLYKVYNQDNVFIGIGSVNNKLLKRDIILI